MNPQSHIYTFNFNFLMNNIYPYYLVSRWQFIYKIKRFAIIWLLYYIRVNQGINLVSFGETTFKHICRKSKMILTPSREAVSY